MIADRGYDILYIDQFRCMQLYLYRHYLNFLRRYLPIYSADFQDTVAMTKVHEQKNMIYLSIILVTLIKSLRGKNKICI